MVATTVIEVGVNVPNASVMIIENAERFGLSQLHQLRGRVGRGAEQSYCILVTNYKLTEDTRKRLEIMVRTNDGFEIAEADLKLRGPGDLEGTQQSGIAFDLKIADIVRDGQLLQYVRAIAESIVEQDPAAQNPENEILWRSKVGTDIQSCIDHLCCHLFFSRGDTMFGVQKLYRLTIRYYISFESPLLTQNFREEMITSGNRLPIIIIIRTHHS